MFEGVIYISGTSRSGSTLMDLLLGGHQDIVSLGEVHHLGAYIDKQGYSYYKHTAHPKPLTCLCGEKVLECPFWSNIERQLDCSLIDLQLDPPYRYKNKINSKIKRINRKIILQYWPRLFLKKNVQKMLGYSDTAQDYYRLYQAAAHVSNTRYVVDSSKAPYRFQYLYGYNESKIKIILLSRDPKAVAASEVKRGGKIVDAITDWNDSAKKMDIFSSNINDKNIIKIRYEDLCNNTENELMRICDFLKLPFLFSSLSFSTVNKHHIGGSPSKFRGDREITLDQTYRKLLSRDDIDCIDKKCNNYKKLFGY